MELSEAVKLRKSELDSMQQDIDNLEQQAAVLKDQVKKFQELKEKSAELKKEHRRKKQMLDGICEFLEGTDQRSYLDNIFPLFSGHEVNAQQSAGAN